MYIWIHTSRSRISNEQEHFWIEIIHVSKGIVYSAKFTILIERKKVKKKVLIYWLRAECQTIKMSYYVIFMINEVIKYY